MKKGDCRGGGVGGGTSAVLRRASPELRRRRVAAAVRRARRALSCWAESWAKQECAPDSGIAVIVSRMRQASRAIIKQQLWYYEQ